MGATPYLAGVVEQAQNEGAVPRHDRHVGDRVLGACHVLRLRQVSVEDVELALDLHGVAIDGVLDLLRRVGVEVAEAAAEVGGGAHLPEEPVEALSALSVFGGQELAELLGQVEKDGARLEDACRFLGAVIDERRDLGVRIGGHVAATELIAIADIDQEGVVLGAAVSESEELLQHDCDLHPVRRRQRVQL